MKKKKGLFGYSIIIVTVLIVLIVIVSSSETRKNKRVFNNNDIRIKDIFSIRQEYNLDELIPHLSIEVLDDGYDIYSPTRSGYRYGPSIIYNEDGTMDAFFAANGNSREWDWITYRHFDGENWEDEKVVLRPTPNSKDHYSTCDPGVIYFDDYYYIGYTSTENAKNGGIENCGYVARSKNITGPYEKWNGEGWGGKPEPIIEYNEDDGQWGAGEISFVIVDEKLYCYYSWICKDGVYTKLALANLEENWPANMEDKDIVIARKNGQDSVDVAYNDKYHKFLAFCVEYRFMANSCIGVYESDDGINFNQIDSIDNITKYAHNMGISKTKQGHINTSEDLLIGYAYSKNGLNTWGKWATRMQSIKLKLFSK